MTIAKFGFVDNDYDTAYCIGDEIYIKFSEPVKISTINSNTILLNNDAIATVLGASVSVIANGFSTAVGTATNDGTYADTFKITLGNGTRQQGGFYYIVGNILKVAKENIVTAQNINSDVDAEITVPTLPIQP